MDWGAPVNILDIWVCAEFLEDMEQKLGFLAEEAADDVDGPHLQVVEAHIHLDYTVNKQFLKAFPVIFL